MNTSVTELQVVEVRSQSSNPVGTVIWLHGLGADGRDFLPILQMWELKHEWNFVFPEANMRPVGMNGNLPMRAWYDIGIDMSTKGEEIDASVAQIYALIEKEVASGIPMTSIVMAGFSQGGVVAQRLVTTAEEKFAGLIALSTYFADFENVRERFTEVNKNTPYFCAHGRFDVVIPIDRARAAAEAVVASGFDLKWHEYDMQHSVDQDEIDDIAAWLNGIGAELAS